jgi:Flp pilus assembly protein TadB
MALLRETLWRAALSGQDQWDALTDLGERIGVPELRDLGALVRLVGRDGARIRQTLTARAATMRRTQLADAEGEAGEKDQSMRLAQILIGFGFILFLTYPAVVNVLAF